MQVKDYLYGCVFFFFFWGGRGGGGGGDGGGGELLTFSDLWLYSPVFVGRSEKPRKLFFSSVAQIYFNAFIMWLYDSY